MFWEPFCSYHSWKANMVLTGLLPDRQHAFTGFEPFNFLLPKEERYPIGSPFILKLLVGKRRAMSCRLALPISTYCSRSMSPFWQKEQGIKLQEYSLAYQELHNGTSKHVYEYIIGYTGIYDNMILDHVPSANTCFDGSKIHHIISDVPFPFMKKVSMLQVHPKSWKRKTWE